MDDADIVARLLNAVDSLASLPIEFAATDLGPDMLTSPRPLVEIYMIRRGSLRFTLRGLTAETRAGDIVIANAHFGSRGEGRGKAPLHACISLAIDEIPALHDLGRQPLLFVRRLRHGSQGQVWAACQANEQALRLSRAAFAAQRRKAAYLQLLLALADGIAGPRRVSIKSNPSGLPEYLMAWVARQSMRAALATDALSADVGLGEHHCNRVFRDAFGCTLRQQHLRLRLERARALLEHTGVSVKQAAAAVGFNDPLYFSRQFKRFFALPPKVFAARGGSRSADLERDASDAR